MNELDEKTRLAPTGRKVAVIACALGMACSGGGDGTGWEDGELASSEPVTRSQALQPTVWDPWYANVANTPLNTDPAICSNHKGFFVTVRNDDQRYYVKRWFYSENPQWKQFGVKQFTSSPTCTMQYPAPLTDTRFLLAGKSTDDRIYVIEGILPEADNQVAPNPDWTGGWAQFQGTQFPGTTNGRPALASSGSRVVLTYVNDNRVYARHRSLPYASNSWSGPNPSTAPQFPAGVTVIGVPAITYMSGSTNKFVVMVRGVSSGVARLYWIYYTTGFQGSWAQASVAPSVSTDPALEYDNVYHALTVYFGSGNEILQTSLLGPQELGTRPIHPIPGQPSSVYIGAPRVVFGGGIEGNRAAVVRGYDGSLALDQRFRAFLLSEVNLIPDPFLE